MSRRYPAGYLTSVEQTYASHPDGTPYVRLVEITTNGGDYDHGAEWDSWSETRRDEHDAWVSDFHDARVDVAWEDPDVREIVDVMIEPGSDLDGPTLRRHLARARDMRSQPEPTKIAAKPK